MKEIKGLYRDCRDCRQSKHKDAFTRNHVFADGIDTLCLECNHRRVREWRANGNRKSAAESRRYLERYPERGAERSNRRKSRVKAATPAWLNRGHRLLIKNYRAVAVLKTFLTGKKWHIDHIVPFAGKEVCGLNVPWNIQIITGKENQSKAAKWVNE